MRKKRIRRSRYFKVGIACAILLFLIFVGFALMEEWERNTSTFPGYETEDKAVRYGGVEYRNVFGAGA